MYGHVCSLLISRKLTCACFPWTEKKAASNLSKPGSLPVRGGKPWNPTGHLLSSAVTMSFPFIRLLQNSDGPLDSGNRQDSPIMSAILLAAAPCSSQTVTASAAPSSDMDARSYMLSAGLAGLIRRLPLCGQVASGSLTYAHAFKGKMPGFKRFWAFHILSDCVRHTWGAAARCLSCAGRLREFECPPRLKKIDRRFPQLRHRWCQLMPAFCSVTAGSSLVLPAELYGKSGTVDRS